jgi:hypothetical protein
MPTVVRSSRAARAAVLIVILTGGLAYAGATPGQKCAAAKRKLAGKKIAALTVCDAKAAAKGTTVDPGCVSKAKAAFMTGWSAIEGKGGCFTTGDEASIENKVDAHQTDLESTLKVTGTTPSKCTAAKFKAAGKKGACKLGCSAKAALTGLPLSDPTVMASLTACSMKFSAGFTAAEKKGDCRTTGDAGTIEGEVDAFVTDVTSELPAMRLRVTTVVGTTSCGGVGFAPPPASPFAGEVDDASATKIADLSLGCLYYGGGNDAVEPLMLAAGATSLFDLSGSDPNLTVAGSSGTAPKDCTRGTGPGMHCISASAADGMSCSGDADCGGSVGSCAPDANCYVGPPLTIPHLFFGGTEPCVVIIVVADSAGTLDAATGSLSLTLPLTARVYLPVGGCPSCTGGICQGGKNNGGACTAVGTGMTSVDCLPADADFTGSAALPLAAFGTDMSVVSAASGLFCISQRTAGAFGLSLARQIAVTGTAAGDLHDGNAHAASLVGNVCVGATANAVIDAATDLPGPGSLTVAGTLQLVR